MNRIKDFFNEMKPLLLFLCLILIILFIGMFFIDKISNETEKAKGGPCSEICESNHETFYKVSSGGYQNLVCYCKDNEGRIRTYVM